MWCSTFSQTNYVSRLTYKFPISSSRICKMRSNRAILLAALLLLQSTVRSSFHGLSMINLVDLATSESLIATEIEKLSSKLLPVFPYLKNYLHDYRLSRGALDPWGVAGNPVAAYAMTSRYFYLLDKLKREIESGKVVQSGAL